MRRSNRRDDEGGQKSRPAESQHAFFVVECPLQSAETLIGKHARVAPAHELVALGIDGRSTHLQERLVVRKGGHVVGVGYLEHIELLLAGLEPSRELRVYRVDGLALNSVVAQLLERFQPFDRGLDSGYAGRFAQP